MLGGVCGGFRPSSGFGGEASPLPVQLHRIDYASAVLFFFVPQVRSELLLWVFKFGRILQVFKLLSSSMKPACWGRPCGEVPASASFCSSSSCCRWCSATAFSRRECPARLPVPDGGERRLLGDRHHDHRWIWRCCSPDGTGRLLASVVMLLGFASLPFPRGS